MRECASQARAAAGDGDVMVHGTPDAEELAQQVTHLRYRVRRP